MHAEHYPRSHDDPTHNVDGTPYGQSRKYSIRRTNDVWQWKLDYPSWSAFVDDVKACIAYEEANEGTLVEEMHRSLESLGKQPTWRELPEEVAPRVETAYQRYLRH